MRLNFHKRPRKAHFEKATLDLGHFLKSLSEDQKELAVNVLHPAYIGNPRQSSSALTLSRLQTYIDEYAKNPLDVIRRQNLFVRFRLWPFRFRWIFQSALLNARIETFMRRKQPEVPDTKSHVELYDQDYLEHGDILPGMQFELGRPQTFYRELLVIKKDSPLTLKFTKFARSLAIRGNSPTTIAKVMYEKLRKVPFGDAKSYPTGQYVGMGTMLHYGMGVCRHKAAMLAVSLQEAGIKATYIRGKYAGVPHGWVEADLEDGRYIIDPSMGHYYKKPDNSAPGFLHTAYEKRNVVWRLRTYSK